MHIYFDIETIPTQSLEIRQKIADEIKPPAVMKKAETIAAWVAEQKQDAINEAIAKTSFDGAYGQICCIGWAINGGEIQSAIGTEPEIIRQFYDAISAEYQPSQDMRPQFIGHNVSDFDLRFLFQRSIITGVKPPHFIPFNSKSWDDRIFDTMTYFAGFGNRISLDKLSKVLGFDGKQEVTGADVWPMYQKGLINEIAEYCRHDVELTRQVHMRLTFA